MVEYQTTLCRFMDMSKLVRVRIAMEYLEYV